MENNDRNWINLKYYDVIADIECGDNSAKTKLAWLKLSGIGGAEVDEDGAMKLLKERVNEGDTDAMWILGMCNEYGIWIGKNVETAKSLYEQSSEGGNNIGTLLMKHEWNNDMGCKNMYINGLFFCILLL